MSDDRIKLSDESTEAVNGGGDSSLKYDEASTAELESGICPHCKAAIKLTGSIFGGALENYICTSCKRKFIKDVEGWFPNFRSDIDDGWRKH